MSRSGDVLLGRPNLVSRLNRLIPRIPTLGFHVHVNGQNTLVATGRAGGRRGDSVSLEPLTANGMVIAAADATSADWVRRMITPFYGPT